MAGSLSDALSILANFRIQNSRDSLRVFEQGVKLLESPSGLWKRKDDDAWLEQLALAAIDIGQLDVADDCIKELADKFPDSPRVDCLIGIRIEATEPAEAALQYYDDLLSKDESNAAAWKRQTSVLRRMGKVDKAAEELSKFLDTYYTDVEGWLELADIYLSCNQYEHAFQSLQHVLLLAPQNPFYALQAAEIAYTLGDVPLASKLFLTVVDMTDSDAENGQQSIAIADSIPEGITVRAWFGVKQCTRKFVNDSRASSHSASQTPVPKHIGLLDELATERLLTAYSSGNGPVNGRDVLVKWLESE